MKILKDSTTFEEEINKDFIVVDFYADWCAPCNMMMPILEEVASEENIEVLKVNIDQFEEIASKYGVMVIPTLIVFGNGKSIKQNTGLLSKSELKEFLSK